MDDFNDVNNLLGQPKRRKARFELVPMVDVIIVLLVVFALFSATLWPRGAMKVDIPVGCDGDSRNVPLILQVTSDRGVYVDRELRDLSELPRLLKAHRQSCEQFRKTPMVLLTGDDYASYGLLIAVMDQVKSAGIDHISFETAYRPSGR